MQVHAFIYIYRYAVILSIDLYLSPTHVIILKTDWSNLSFWEGPVFKNTKTLWFKMKLKSTCTRSHQYIPYAYKTDSPTKQRK